MLREIARAPADAAPEPEPDRPLGPCLELFPPMNRWAVAGGVKSLEHHPVHAKGSPFVRLPPNSIYLEAGKSTPLPGYDYGSFIGGDVDLDLLDQGSWIVRRSDGTVVATPPPALDGAALTLREYDKNDHGLGKHLFVIGPAAAAAVARIYRFRPPREAAGDNLQMGKQLAPASIVALVQTDLDGDGRPDAVAFVTYDFEVLAAVVTVTGDEAALRWAPVRSRNCDLDFPPFYTVATASGTGSLLFSENLSCGGIEVEMFVLEPDRLRAVRSELDAVTDMGELHNSMCLYRPDGGVPVLRVGRRHENLWDDP